MATSWLRKKRQEKLQARLQEKRQDRRVVPERKHGNVMRRPRFLRNERPLRRFCREVTSSQTGRCAMWRRLEKWMSAEWLISDETVLAAVLALMLAAMVTAGLRAMFAGL